MTKKNLIIICVMVCCLCLILLSGLLDKPKIINQDEIIYDSFSGVDMEAQIVEIPTQVEPYQAVFDEEMIYYLGRQLEDDGSFDGDGIALYELSCEEKTGEIGILEVKQSQKADKDNLKLIKDGMSQDEDTLMQWTWDYDGNLEKTSLYHGKNTLWSRCESSQEGERFALWNGNLYWFEQQDQKTFLYSMNKEMKTSMIAKDVHMPSADILIEDGYLVFMEGEQNQILRLQLENQKNTEKIMMEGISLQNVQGNGKYMVCTDQRGDTYAYDFYNEKTYGLGKADILNGTALAYLRGDKVWLVQENNKVAVYDLINHTQSTIHLPEMEYADFYMDCNGTLLGCSSKGRKCVVVRE